MKGAAQRSTQPMDLEDEDWHGDDNCRTPEEASGDETSDEEKEAGLGLPVDVTNSVAQAQMVGDIQADQQAALGTHQNELQQRQDMGMQQEELKEQKSVGTFVKLKQIL